MTSPERLDPERRDELGANVKSIKIEENSQRHLASIERQKKVERNHIAQCIKVRERLVLAGYTTGIHVDFLDESGNARVIGDLGNYLEKKGHYVLLHDPKYIMRTISVIRLALLADVEISDLIPRAPKRQQQTKASPRS